MKRWKVVNEDRNSYPGEITPVHYAEGATLESKTLGFFVLPTLQAAEDYRRENDFWGERSLQIIEVECFGRSKTMQVCPTTSNNISYFIANKRKILAAVKRKTDNGLNIHVGGYITLAETSVWKCAEGTLTYKKLKVLT